MEMFPSTPRLCHLHIYLIVPDTTGNKSAVRHAGSSSAASESRDLHQHLPTAPIKLPGKFSKACRAFPHLMVFSPSLQPLEAGISKVEKHHLHWPQRGRLKILRIFISPGTCSTSSPGSSDRLRTSVQTFSCLTELPNLPGSAWRRAESGGVRSGNRVISSPVLQRSHPAPFCSQPSCLCPFQQQHRQDLRAPTSCPSSEMFWRLVCAG